MDRRELLLSMFDPDGFGLEVGPSYNPLLPKSLGYRVETVDHVDAATLREKYSGGGVDISRIEDVDYVSDGGSLVELIGETGKYDFIVASHVIEHVTDIIRFLRDCEELLKPDGVLVLAVPDKRFCFDVLRPVSTVGQALQAFHEKRVRHTPGSVFDHISLVCAKAGNEVWLEPTLDDLELRGAAEEVRATYETVRASDDYVDVHGWQFTPSHFRYFIKTLRDIGYIGLGEQSFRRNSLADGIHLHEFYITLSKSAPDLTISALELLKESEREVREIQVSRDDAEVWATSRAKLETELRDLRQKFSRARAEVDELTTWRDRLEVEAWELREELAHVSAANAALRESTSWTLTAPLRRLSTLFKGRLD